MKLISLVAVFAPFVELAARVAADPNNSHNSLRVPIKKRFNAAHPGALKPAQRDLIRSNNLLGGVKRRDSLAKVDGIALTLDFPLYTASIGVGNPPTSYELLIDTGSSNTWVGANKNYVVTDTSVKTSDKVNLTGVAGSVIGTEYTDSVTIAPGMVISKQSIGVASGSSFHGLDGILGIGPSGLTRGTLIPSNTNVIQTVTDNLFVQGIIEKNLIAMSFEPTDSESLNGELTFGGTDPTKFTGPITYAPLTNIPPSSSYWGINASFRYGNSKITDLKTTAGFVDTGTALLGFSQDAFTCYVNAIGAVHDPNTNLHYITKAQYNTLESLFFEIDGTRFELIPNAQIWPQSRNAEIRGKEDVVYLAVFNSDSVLPSPRPDFVMGMLVLERLYTVFDTANKRVGFATTQSTHAEFN